MGTYDKTKFATLSSHFGICCGKDAVVHDAPHAARTEAAVV